MSALFRRELRRLAPYGLGVPLGLLALFFLLRASFSPHADLELFVVLALPGILGVATVAPDTGSGAAAFLARLPLSSTRVFAAKLLAAATWLSLGVLLLAAVDQPLGPSLRARTAGLLPFAFGAGVLASVMAHRTMPALLLAPALAAFCGLAAFVFPVAWLGITFLDARFPLTIFPLLSAICLACAFGAFVRGDRHRLSPRPALIALGGLAPAMMLLLVSTKAAHAWSVEAVVPHLDVLPGAAEGPSHVAVSLAGANWTGLEQRVLLVDRDEQVAKVIPARGVGQPELSPDGTRLLLRNTLRPGGWLVHLPGGSQEELAAGDLKEGFGFPHVLWRQQGPLLLRLRNKTLEAFEPRAGWIGRTQIERKAEIVGVRPDGAVVLRDAEGLHLLSHVAEWPEPSPSDPCLEQGWRAPRYETRAMAGILALRPLLSWPAGFKLAGARLSPGGRYVLTRPASTERAPVLFDLHDTSHLVLPGLDERLGRVPQAPARVYESRVQRGLDAFGVFVYGFSPGDAHLLVERCGSAAALVHLAEKRAQPFRPARASLPGRPVAWAPDGSVATLPSGITISAASGEVLAHEPVATYLRPDRVLRPHRPLGLYELLSGRHLHSLAHPWKN